MKATGIVRRIDDLGRVVIPKEIRRTMRIREGDPLEIYTDAGGEVIFKKYSPIGELSNFAGEYADAYGTIAPWVHTVDFKYAHDFTVKVGNTRNTLRLSVDVANLLTLFNSHWGVAWSPNQTVSDSNNQIKLLNYEYTDKDGVPVFSTRVGANQKTWEHTSTYGDCWYMQIGLKYMFN